MVKFIGGCLTGVMLTGMLLMAGGFTAYHFFMKPMMDDLADHIKPPPFPVDSEPISGILSMLDLEENLVTIAVGGGKTLVINMWATWCPPCVAEIPSLATLAAMAEDLGITVVCVSEEPVMTLKAWCERKKSTAPIYHLKEMPMEMGNDGIPETWIIGPTGKVEFKHTGMADWAHDSVIEYIRSVTGQAAQEENSETLNTDDVPGEQQPQDNTET